LIWRAHRLRAGHQHAAGRGRALSAMPSSAIAPARTSPDFGHFGHPDGPALWGYARNAPGMMVDPRGETGEGFIGQLIRSLRRVNIIGAVEEVCIKLNEAGQGPDLATILTSGTDVTRPRSSPDNYSITGYAPFQLQEALARAGFERVPDTYPVQYARGIEQYTFYNSSGRAPTAAYSVRGTSGNHTEVIKYRFR
jgi:hypothetical protein